MLELLPNDLLSEPKLKNVFRGRFKSSLSKKLRLDSKLNMLGRLISRKRRKRDMQKWQRTEPKSWRY